MGSADVEDAAGDRVAGARGNAFGVTDPDIDAGLIIGGDHGDGMPLAGDGRDDGNPGKARRLQGVFEDEKRRRIIGKEFRPRERIAGGDRFRLCRGDFGYLLPGAVNERGRRQRSVRRRPAPTMSASLTVRRLYSVKHNVSLLGTAELVESHRSQKIRLQQSLRQEMPT